MKHLILAAMTGAALTASMSALGAPYEDYKMQIQRQAEARRSASTPNAASEHHDPATMRQHMQLMQEMDDQLQQARAVDTMSREQMREWIVKHTALMSRMHEQMMNEHHPMGGGGSMHRHPK